MRKFSFRLQSVLKLKEFDESKRKIELGQINQKRKKIEDKIKQCHNNIEVAAEEERCMLSSATNAEFLPFYPRYVKAQSDHIENLNAELEQVKEEYADKLLELNKARGDVKIFEKLKENALNKYKKDVRRRELIDIEEMINIKRAREKRL